MVNYTISPVLLIFGTFILLTSCATISKPKFSVVAGSENVVDYANLANWAAWPERKDVADSLATPELFDVQDTARVDVFFLHPTTYIKKGKWWNADLTDEELNKNTDNSSILYQASIFNGAGRVYAPRYRQAHIKAYFVKEKDKAVAEQAFELAYKDIERAFSYYLEHENNGRPIIIAAHSQGTTHGMRLVKQFFDGKPLHKQLVAAYLVGLPVLNNYFENIKVCTSPEENGCICAWQTFRKGYYPKFQPPGSPVMAVNPLTWTNLPDYAPKTLNQGAILRKFNQIFPQLADAQVHDGLLWIHKPKFPGSFFVWTPKYHIADYNLFYMNVRSNAIARAAHFLSN